MRKRQKSRRWNSQVAYLLFFLLLLILASLACGGSTTDELEEAAQPIATESKVEPTAAPVQEESQEDASLAEEEATKAADPSEEPPTAVPEPTEIPSTPTPVLEPIVVSKYGFGQDDNWVRFAFIVDNPNTGLSFEEAQYQVGAFDDSGTVVGTESGYVGALLPEQKLGIGGTMYLEDGISVSSIDIQLNAGGAEPSDTIPTFTVESESYFQDDYDSSVSGLVTSPYNRDFDALRVSAVLYDAAGEIIGGGFTYLDFILANDSAGIELLVTSAGEVASVELFPNPTGLSMLGSDDEIPQDASELVLLEYGFGEGDFGLGFGLILENPNDNYSIRRSNYHVAAFAADGSVLGMDQGYIAMLFPGQTLGVGGDLFTKGDMPVDMVVAKIKAGDYVSSESVPFFTSDNVAFQEGSYKPQVTGLILSPYNTDIKDVRVSAILFDADGNIVGGGYTVLDYISGNGQAAVELFVSSSGTPARAELYAAVLFLTDFE
jgi:hypothetical protein